MKTTNKFKWMILLIAAMLVLAGCSLHQKDISGVYTTSMLIRDIYDDETIQEFEESGMTFFLDIPVSFVFELNEDKSFVFRADVEEFKQNVFNGLDENIGVFLEAALDEHGIAPERYEEFAQYNGYPDYEEMKQNYLEKMKKSIEDNEEMWEGISQTAEGTYEVKNDTVTFTTSAEGIEIEQATVGEDGSLMLDTYIDDDRPVTMIFKP